MAEKADPPSTEMDGMEVDLLSAEESSTSVDSVVRSPKNWAPIGLLAGGMMVLAVWLGSSVISGSSQSEEDVLRAPDSTEPDQGPTANQATASDPTVTTLDPTTTPPSVFEAGAPIDPDSTLSLIITQESTLRAIDFSSGDAVEFSQPGDPKLVIDDYLLLSMNDTMRAVPLTNLGGDAIDLPIRPWGNLAPSEQPNTIWGQEVSNDALARLGPVALVDLTTGQVLQRLDPEDPAGMLSAGSGAWPNLVTGRGGGVYERTDDGLRKRTPGSLRAGGDEFALIETCDDLHRCELTWFDQTTWEPASGRLIPDNIGLNSQLTGGDRVLVSSSDNLDAPPELFDVIDGHRLRLPQSLFGEYVVTVGPRGRWVAYYSWGHSDVTVQTLDRASVTTIPDVGTGGSMVITQLP